MSSGPEIIKQNHRRQWAMSASGVIGLLVLSVLPHNERGLFIVDSAEARALSAIVAAPDLDAVPLFPANGGPPSAFFARVPGVPGVPAGPIGGLGGPANPAGVEPGLPPAATDPNPAIFGSQGGDTPIQTASLGTGPFGSGFPFGPGGLGPTNAGPAAVFDAPGTSTGGGSTSTGGDTSTGGGTTSTGGGTSSTSGSTSSTGGGTTSTGGDTSTGGGTTSTGGGTSSTGGDTSTSGGMTSTSSGSTSGGDGGDGGTSSTGGNASTSGGMTSTSSGATSGGTSSGGDIPIPAVPEPTTWMMMIAGFAMVGVALRRSRRQRLNSAQAGAPSS